LAYVILLRIQMGKLPPRQHVFEVAPNALDRVQLGTIGRQPDRADIRRQNEPLGRVGTAVIQEQDVQAIGVRLGKGVEEDLEHLGMEVGEFEKEALAGGRRHCTVDIEPLEDVLDRSDRLDAACGKAAAAHGQQAQTTFVLTEHSHRAVLRWRDDAPKLLQTACLKLADGFGVFLCDGAVPP
jgi:hypothetical protein